MNNETRHCLSCHKPLIQKTVTRKDGYVRLEDKRSFIARKYCDPQCHANHRKNQPRLCRICGNEIPRVTKSGKPMEHTNYKAKKTCGSPKCYSALRRMTANSKNGLVSKYYQEPDLIESWYLGGERKEPSGKPIKGLSEMMNDIINPRYGV